MIFSTKTIWLRLLSFLAMVTGMLTVIGWLCDISVLRSVFPGFPAMRFNSALALITVGFTLYLIIIDKWKYVSGVLSVLVILYGAANLYEDIAHVQLGIDDFFFKDGGAQIDGYPPGHPSVSSTVCFILIGNAFLVLNFGKKNTIVVAQYLLHVVSFISFIAILGYLLNSSSISTLRFFNTLSLNMAVQLLLLSLGAATIHPDKGITSLFTGKKMGNIMARRLFPQMLIFLVLVSALRMLAFRHHWLAEESGIATSITTYFVITLFLIWYNAANLNVLDDKRKLIEEEIIDLNKSLEETVKDLADYKFALDASSIVAITDREGIITYANDNFCRISKYKAEELLGQNHRILNSGYHDKEFFRNLWQTIAAGKIWKGEIKNVTKDGTFYWVDTTIIPILDVRNKPSKYLAIRADVTERVRFLEELKTSEEMYRNLYENTLVSIITTDMRTLKPITVNDVAVQLFGYKSKEDFLKNYDAAAHFVDGSEREKNIATVLQTGELKSKVQPMKRLDGTIFWIKLFIKLGSNHVAETVLIDITNQVTAQKNLEAKVKELENANKELESFNYIASHDLQEPLRKIQNFVSVLLSEEKARLSSQGNFYLDRVSATSKKMQSLIGDLLTYSRATKKPGNYEKVGLNDIIHEIISDLKGTIEEKKAILRVNAPCEIYAIRFQIRQLFTNLVANALKFTEPGRQPEITITAQSTNGSELSNPNLSPATHYCHVQVADNGIGFDTQYNERIFEIFERLEDPDKYQGTGIGLAICKKIVINHNGIITAKGEVGKGARFDIYLPETRNEAQN